MCGAAYEEHRTVLISVAVIEPRYTPLVKCSFRPCRSRALQDPSCSLQAEFRCNIAALPLPCRTREKHEKMFLIYASDGICDG
jgi:hypothetical protein